MLDSTLKLQRKGAEVVNDGISICCYLDGMLHSDEGPAYIDNNGTQKWFQHGVLHREEEPAVCYLSAGCEWYRQGKIYKEKYADGTLVFYDDRGRYHREDGPAVEHANGDNLYYLNGKQLFGGDLEDFLMLLSGDDTRLPLLINNDLLKEMVKKRLQGLS